MFFVRGVALYRAFSLAHGSSCDYLPLMVLECTKMRIVAIGSPDRVSHAQPQNQAEVIDSVNPAMHCSHQNKLPCGESTRGGNGRKNLSQSSFGQ